MVLTPSFTGQFKQDRKRAAKRGWDIELLDRTIGRLIAQETLEPRHKVHMLRGGYAGHWECHLMPDFLLIWYYSGDADIVFVRAGSHSDLFG